MPATALDFDKMVENMINILQMEGPIDEGTEGKLNDLGSGVKKNYVTYPNGPVVNHSGEGVGTLNFPYECRKRTEVYNAGVKTSTEDSQHPAVITADFEFTVRGKVLVTNIKIEGNQPGRCGNSVLSRVQGLNGQDVS